VVASSSSVYGGAAPMPTVETEPLLPRSPYAVSKMTVEHHARVFNDLFAVETVALRYFNVFGERQDPTSHYSAVIPKFITAMLAGQPPFIHGDGEQSRDFTYVSNVVDANLLAASSPSAAGNVVNVACGARVTLNELCSMLAESIPGAVPPEHGPPRAGDVRHSLADITLARDVLGYTPAVDFRSGLDRSREYYEHIATTALKP
jgi:UDP-glucose 4-epimerase